MVQADQKRKRNSPDKKRKKERRLHITFHNPNTIDEMAKLLTKLIINNYIEQEFVSSDNCKKENTR
jgi:hypothetical protein